MDANIEYFEKFIVKKIVNTVEYRPETDEYEINRIHLTDETLQTIEKEGSRYGLKPQETMQIVTMVAENVRTMPSVQIKQGSILVNDLKIGQHLRINIVHPEKGKHFVEMLLEDEETFIVLDTSIPGIQFGDKLQSIDKIWNSSFYIDFKAFKYGQPFPNEKDVLRIGKVTSVEFFSPSVVHEIIDSKSSFTYKSLNAKNALPNEEAPDKSLHEQKPLPQLLDDIDLWVKYNSIGQKYADLLANFKTIGISSYILNLFILKSKEAQKTNGKNVLIENDYIVNKDEDGKISEDISKTEPKKIRTHRHIRLSMVLLPALCIAEFGLLVGLNIEKNDLSSELRQEAAQHKELKQTINSICIKSKEHFVKWKSDNHKDYSESEGRHLLEVTVGDRLTFDYHASTEYNYDFLTITIQGNDLRTRNISEQLVKTSGIIKKSYSYIFPKSGSYYLYMKYKKDGSYSKNEDLVEVSKIVLHRNCEPLLDSIRTLCQE